MGRSFVTFVALGTVCACAGVCVRQATVLTAACESIVEEVEGDIVVALAKKANKPLLTLAEAQNKVCKDLMSWCK